MPRLLQRNLNVELEPALQEALTGRLQRGRPSTRRPGRRSTAAGLTQQARHLSPAPCKRVVVLSATARFSLWRRLSFSHVTSALALSRSPASSCISCLQWQRHCSSLVAVVVVEPTGCRQGTTRPRRQSIGPRAGTKCLASGLRPSTGARRRKISWTPPLQGRGDRLTWYHDRHQRRKERRVRRRTRADHHVPPRLMNPLLLVEPHAEAERRRRRRLGALALQTLPAAVPGEPG
jgi:hypothetical protein